MAGALGAMAAVLLSGRADWMRRIHFFGVCGAIGWSFGGSMSYMKSIAYAQSSDPMTLAYGFVCLFVIGFLWAAPGGAATALPAVLTREELTAGFIPACAVLAAWWVQDIAVDLLHDVPDIYDSDWLGATVALAAAAAVAVARRRIEHITSLILHMAAGWWIMFTILVLGFELHMNPPRGDNWAGCAGMVVGILVWCRSRVMPRVELATLVAGFLGGIGFSLGHTVKLLGLATGWRTNWHSVMEQSQGFFLGIAIAVAVANLAGTAPALRPEQRMRWWTEVFSVTFLLVLIPYVNFRKSPGDWAHLVSGMADWMYGIAAAGWLIPSHGFIGWTELLFGALAAAIVYVCRRRPLAALPDRWQGRGHLLYLALLWELVFINAIHVLPRWTPERLVTEWVVAMNAVVCAALVLSGPSLGRWYRITMPQAVAIGAAGMLVVTVGGYGVRRALFGAGPAGGESREHVRFGSNNTNTIK